MIAAVSMRSILAFSLRSINNFSRPYLFDILSNMRALSARASTACSRCFTKAMRSFLLFWASSLARFCRAIVCIRTAAAFWSRIACSFSFACLFRVAFWTSTAASNSLSSRFKLTIFFACLCLTRPWIVVAALLSLCSRFKLRTFFACLCLTRPWIVVAALLSLCSRFKLRTFFACLCLTRPWIVVAALDICFCSRFAATKLSACFRLTLPWILTAAFFFIFLSNTTAFAWTCLNNDCIMVAACEHASWASLSRLNTRALSWISNSTLCWFWIATSISRVNRIFLTSHLACFCRYKLCIFTEACSFLLIFVFSKEPSSFNGIKWLNGNPSSSISAKYKSDSELSSSSTGEYGTSRRCVGWERWVGGDPLWRLLLLSSLSSLTFWSSFPFSSSINFFLCWRGGGVS